MKAKFNAKTRTILKTGTSRDFNNFYMIIKAEFIMVMQKNQTVKLVFVHIEDNTNKSQYVVQCTCRAYIALIYQ